MQNSNNKDNDSLPTFKEMNILEDFFRIKREKETLEKENESLKSAYIELQKNPKVEYKEIIKEIPVPTPYEKIVEKEVKSVEFKYLPINETTDWNTFIENTGFKKPNLFLKYYVTPIFIILFNIIGLAGLFIVRDIFGMFFSIVLIFYVGLALPLFLGITGYYIIRLYIDKNRIFNKIIPVLPSKNFIVANFILPQKRKLKRICMLDKDNISFTHKKSRYVIDMEKIYYDEDNFPNGDWLPNLPNQLAYDYTKELKQVENAYNLSNMAETKEALKDRNGNIIDVNYSSKNLEVFKNDKLFYEFHQQITPETMKIIYVMCAIVAICVIGFIIIFVTK